MVPQGPTDTPRTRRVRQPYGGAMAWHDVFEQYPDVRDAVGDRESSDEGDDDDLDFEMEDDVVERAEESAAVIDPELLDGASRLDQDIEEDIQDDFEVLLQQMRSSDGSGRAKLNEEFAISDTNMDLREELRAAARIGRPRRAQDRRRTQYSQEVLEMISEAEHAFVQQQRDEAIRLAYEIIRIEPKAAQAWSVLIGAYGDMGDSDTQLKLRIMKAHLETDGELWKELAIESKEMGLKRQALYCLRKAIQLDKTDIDAIWDRSFLLKDMGETKLALQGFLSILNLLPHDPHVLDQIHQLCLELDDVKDCLQLYQDAFEHFRRFPPSEENFGLRSLIILADLHIRLGNYERAIQVVKSGARWLQNRPEETSWDLVEDDREYDPHGTVRDTLEGQPLGKKPGYHPLPLDLRHRLAIARLNMGDDVEAKIHVDVIRSSDRALHFEFFMEIADVLFDRHLWDDALEVYEQLEDLQLPLEARTLRLYWRMGQCLRNLGRLEQAVEILELVVSLAPDNLDAKMDLAYVYEATGQTLKALDLAQQVQLARKQLRTRGPDDDSNDDQMETGLFDEVVPARPNTRRLVWEEKIALEREHAVAVQTGFDRIRHFNKGEEDDDPVAVAHWMKEAGKLVDSFREARVLFPADRYRKYTGSYDGLLHSGRPRRKEVDFDRDVANMASRLQESIEEGPEPSGAPRDDGDRHFRGVDFDEWLTLILKYSFRLLSWGHTQDADDVLRHTSLANVYSYPRYQDVFSLALLACALHTNNAKQITEQARKIMFVNQFNNDAIRLLLAALGSGLAAYGQFTDTKLAKFLIREIRIANAIVHGAELRFSEARQRYTLVKAAELEEPDDKDEAYAPVPAEGHAQTEGETESTSGAGTGAPGDRKAPRRALTVPKKGNPVTLTVYGQMLLAVKSYQNALFYLMQAYEMNPNDPMMCLTIAVAYAGRAMQRQSDNRHHQIVQGLAFLSRYRNVRGVSGVNEEVEYNFGRYFHQLGILNLAATHYRRVLSIAKAKRGDGEALPLDVPVREAAYNLSLIYVTSGATDLAQGLYSEWLIM